MIVRFPLHLLKQAAIRSAYNDKKEAEYIASQFATAVTEIEGAFGYPKFPEDDKNEEDAGCSERID